jgi:hypothetical protein
LLTSLQRAFKNFGKLLSQHVTRGWAANKKLLSQLEFVIAKITVTLYIQIFNLQWGMSW